MKERTFNTEVKNSLIESGAWAYKIPDAPIFPGQLTRFTGDKPCDIVGGYRGHFFGIESKQVKKYEAFGLRFFRPCQIENLDKMVAGENAAFAFLNIRQKKPYINRLLIFDWADETWKRETIKKRDLEILSLEEGIVGKNGLFDLGSFLEDLACGTI